MAAHIELPALDPAPITPATLQPADRHGLLRGEMGFGGLVYTDSMSMDAVAQALARRRARSARSRPATTSCCIRRTIGGVRGDQGGGRRAADVRRRKSTQSVARMLRAKARWACTASRAVDLDAVPRQVGGRAHEAVAQEAFSEGRSRWCKDDRNQVPLRVPRDAPVLYLSVLDYPSGWRIAAPSRTFIPELKKRWPNVTAIEVSDRTTR